MKVCVLTVTNAKPVHISIFSTKPVDIITLAIQHKSLSYIYYLHAAYTNFIQLLLEIHVCDETRDFLYT